MKNKIENLKDLLETIKENIAEINYQNTVVDDSQLSRLLDRISKDSNFMLIGVIPSINVSGSMDQFKFSETNVLFVLKKTDSSAHDHDSFLDIMNDTGNVMDKVMGVMSELATNGDCFYLNTLKPQFHSVEPVWLKNGCNGWMLTYTNQ